MRRFSLSPGATIPTSNEHNSAWLRPQKLRFVLHKLQCQEKRKHDHFLRIPLARSRCAKLPHWDRRNLRTRYRADDHFTPPIQPSSHQPPTTTHTNHHHTHTPFSTPTIYHQHPHLPNYTCKRAVLPNTMGTKVWSAYGPPRIPTPEMSPHSFHYSHAP